MKAPPRGGGCCEYITNLYTLRRAISTKNNFSNIHGGRGAWPRSARTRGWSCGASRGCRTRAPPLWLLIWRGTATGWVGGTRMRWSTTPGLGGERAVLPGLEEAVASVLCVLISGDTIFKEYILLIYHKARFRGCEANLADHGR